MSNISYPYISAIIIDDDNDNDNTDNTNNNNNIIQPPLITENTTNTINTTKTKRKYTYKSKVNHNKKNKLQTNELEQQMNTDEQQMNEDEQHTTNKKEQQTIIIPPSLLKPYFDQDLSVIEIGIDEDGRGPLFGRVYAAGVILPKSIELFQHHLMKDSKKFNSKNNTIINNIAQYIKDNCIAWSIQYEDENIIDQINILQATQSAMHKCIRHIIEQLKEKHQHLFDYTKLFLLIDGNYFNPYIYTSPEIKKITYLRHVTIEKGDNNFTSIAAASILAKVERDKYIHELCIEDPNLNKKYGLLTNKGYGSKKHLDGIKLYGIDKHHRKTFGICKQFDVINE